MDTLVSRIPKNDLGGDPGWYPGRRLDGCSPDRLESTWAAPRKHLGTWKPESRSPAACCSTNSQAPTTPRVRTQSKGKYILICVKSPRKLTLWPFCHVVVHLGCSCSCLSWLTKPCIPSPIRSCLSPSCPAQSLPLTHILSDTCQLVSNM